MAGETCVDFDFSDILSKIDDTPIAKNKISHVNGFLKPVSYNFDLDSISNFNLTLSLKDDSSDDDLSVLLDSHHSQNHESPGLVSLAALAKDHFSNTLSSSLTKNFEEDTQDSFLFDLNNLCTDESESVDCLQDILLGENCEDQGKKANFGDVLNFLDLKSETDVNVDNSIQKEKIVSKEETFDDELIQDIDLSFCLKKSKDKAEFLPGSLNSDSKDSGFGDYDSSLSQFSSSSSDKIITFENLKKSDQINFKLTRAKQSLFSRSIAAKPQIDKMQRKKLNAIKSELLKKNINLPSEHEREQIMKKYLIMMDQSNQCVMTSSFMTIPDPK